MKKLLHPAAALVCAVGLSVSALGQMTSITATSIQMAGAPIASGTIAFIPVNSVGQPVPITAGGSLYDAQGFTAAITNGAVADNFQVPDSCTASPVTPNTSLSYAVQIYNSTTKQSFTLQHVTGVCGENWDLDSYVPTQTAVVSSTGLVSGTTVPAHCSNTSIFYKQSSPSAVYTCVAGVYVQMSGDGGSIDLPHMTSLLKGDGSGGALAAIEGTDYATPASVVTAADAATAAQTTANAAISSTQKGAANGVATLDSTSKVPFSQMPAAVPGITVSGDSIACATGASTTDKGYAYLLRAHVGGVYRQLCRSGDQAADQNYQHVFPSVSPLGGGADPLYISEVGTNDVTAYNSDANKQNVFRRLELGQLSWMALPITNKILGQKATVTTGTCAADNTIQNGVAETCTTSGAKLTFNITTTVANQAVYVWYLIGDGATGSFNLSLDGTNQTDGLNSSTTFVSSGDGGVAIATTNGAKAGVAGFRFTVPTAGSHAVAATSLAAANMTIVAVGVSPSSLSTSNPYVVAVSPNHQNNANDTLTGTYAGFVQTIATQLAGDNLNVIYANTRDALGTNYATYYSDVIHPNDAGHALMDSTIESLLPASFLTANTIPNDTQVPTTNSTYDSVDPSQYWSPNPTGTVLPHGWGRGIEWYQFAGTHYFTAYLFNTGLTFGFPNNGGVVDYCVYGYKLTSFGGQFPGHLPATTDCYFSLSGNGAATLNTQTAMNGPTTITAIGGSQNPLKVTQNAIEGSALETVLAKNIFTQGVASYGVQNDIGKEFSFGVGSSAESSWGVANKFFIRDLTNSSNFFIYDPSTATTTFGGQVSAPLTGPATAPSGSCTVNGQWVLSQDGHATFCASGTWATKI